MKNLILTAFFSIIYLGMYAETDTCGASHPINISDTICVNEINTIDTLHLNENDSISTDIKISKHEIKTATKTKTKSKVLLQKAAGLGDFFDDLWDALSSLWKPVWGYYEENGMNHGGPYFLFNRDSDNA